MRLLLTTLLVFATGCGLIHLPPPTTQPCTQPCTQPAPSLPLVRIDGLEIPYNVPVTDTRPWGETVEMRLEYSNGSCVLFTFDRDIAASWPEVVVDLSDFIPGTKLEYKREGEKPAS